MLYYERKFKKKGYTKIVGVDEVGRGCLAGPVVAGAVLLKNTSFAHRIDDSKKLSPLQRERAFFEIIEKSFFGIGIINEQVIDRVNILQATCLAMEQAVSALLSKLKGADAANTCLLVDGNVRFHSQLPLVNIIAGDSKSKSIACASILAKVIRDRIMRVYDRVFPEYGFLAHKGYGTAGHRSALKKFGPSLIHRTSFHGVIS